STMSNTATVTSTPPDPNPANNSITASTTLTNSADLTITKTGPDGATLGNTITYSISVTNNGPSPAASASFSDTLPPGTTFSSVTQKSGPTFSCTTGATVTCTIASLPSGTTATFTLVANVVSGPS